MSDVVYMPLSVQARIRDTIQALPSLTAQDIPLDESCPICLNKFSSILEAEVDDEAESITSSLAPKHPELAGVTKLEGCGHMFCRLE